jgi:hypothetical protein
MAEEVGFEPTELSLYGFQDRRHRPLGHSSNETSIKNYELQITNHELRIVRFNPQ